MSCRRASDARRQFAFSGRRAAASGGNVAIGVAPGAVRQIVRCPVAESRMQRDFATEDEGDSSTIIMRSSRRVR